MLPSDLGNMTNFPFPNWSTLTTAASDRKKRRKTRVYFDIFQAQDARRKTLSTEFSSEMSAGLGAATHESVTPKELARY